MSCVSNLPLPLISIAVFKNGRTLTDAELAAIDIDGNGEFDTKDMMKLIAAFKRL